MGATRGNPQVNAGPEGRVTIRKWRNRRQVTTPRTVPTPQHSAWIVQAVKTPEYALPKARMPIEAIPHAGMSVESNPGTRFLKKPIKSARAREVAIPSMNAAGSLPTTGVR